MHAIKMKTDIIFNDFIKHVCVYIYTHTQYTYTIFIYATPLYIDEFTITIVHI